MFPPQTRTAVRWLVSEVLCLQECGQGSGARSFGEELFAFEQNEDGLGDFFFIHGDDFVDIFLDVAGR